MHPETKATLSRCAQPLTGMKGSRCVDDEKLIDEIRKANPTNPKIIYLMDARPYKAAIGNTVMGKGFEKISNYKVCGFVFVNNCECSFYCKLNIVAKFTRY